MAETVCVHAQTDGNADLAASTVHSCAHGCSWRSGMVMQSVLMKMGFQLAIFGVLMYMMRGAI